MSEHHMAAVNVGKTRPALPISSQGSQPMTILTDRDVNKILERKLGGGNFQLVGWSLEHLDETKGFLGQYYHLRITAETNGRTESLQFFAKTPPPADGPVSVFLQRFDTFNKEVAVYMDLIQQMGTGGRPKWCVECYFCKRDNIIILEDASINGYATLDKYVPFDEEHCVWLLRTLSRLHSRSLILDENLRRECSRTVFDLYGHLLNEVLFVEGDDKSERALAASIKGFCAAVDVVEEINGIIRTSVKRRFAEWCRKIPRLLAPSGKHRNVICHRDTWANNLMFRHDPTGNPNGCYIIDFQFLRYCPPAIDFACCLYLTTDRAIRDRHFDTFAKIYHDSLAQGLSEEGLNVEDYLSWTSFRKSYSEARNIALVYAGLNLQIILLSNDATVDYFGGAADRLERVLYSDERSDLVWHQCRNVPAYKSRLSEIILEIGDRLPEHPPDV